MLICACVASASTRQRSLRRSRCIPCSARSGAARTFNSTKIDADLVHCHTWYSHFGGIVAKLNYGIPLVVTVHSLEPLRPWKREQLGGGYDFTVWLEKTALEMADAVIAVSGETKRDLERLFDIRPERLHVIYNGIDLDEYQKVDTTAAVAALRDRSGSAASCSSSAGSRGRRGSFTWSARSGIWRRDSRWCCARVRPIRPKSGRKWKRRSRRPAPAGRV
jgi:glycosyltransferase involved in cell wall biosynthesis